VALDESLSRLPRSMFRHRVAPRQTARMPRTSRPPP